MTEIDDQLAIETLLVEQFGHITIDGFLAVFASVALNRNGDLLEAVLSNEDSEDARARIISDC